MLKKIRYPYTVTVRISFLCAWCIINEIENMFSSKGVIKTITKRKLKRGQPSLKFDRGFKAHYFAAHFWSMIFELGWRICKSARQPDTNVVRVRFLSDQCHMWHVFCWFSPCSKGFSPGFPVFLPSQKPTSSIFNSTSVENLHENQLRLMWFFL